MLIILLASASLTGCGAGNMPASLDSLRVAGPSAPLTLNPLFVRDAASAEVVHLLHAPLLRSDPRTLAVLPGIISGWEISSDGRSYLLRLRDDVHWSDGRPVTADDVAFTLRVLCHPDYTGWLYPFADRIKGAAAYRENHTSPFADGNLAGLQVLDDYSLRIVLTKPYAPFLSNLVLPPLPAHYLSTVEVAALEGDDYSRRAPVVTGPFVLSAWRADEYIHFRANPRHYLGCPKIDSIYYRIIPHPETQIIELMRGRLDLLPTAVRVEDAAALAAHPRLNVYRNRRLVYDYLAFNLKNGHPALTDRRVRLALSLLPDRQQIVDRLLLGLGEVALGPLHPLHFAYDPGLPELRPDTRKARELLQKAAVLPLRIRLIYNAGNPVRENVALLFREQAAAVGVDVSLTVLEWESFAAALRKGEYDLAVLGRSADIDPDLFYHWHSTGPGNLSGYLNKEVDALLEAAASTHELQERTYYYRRAQRLIVGDMPMIWLYYRQAIHAASQNLSNFNPHPETPFHKVHLWELSGD
jgi:peptide/nickel transport system substrate-binding protein